MTMLRFVMSMALVAMFLQLASATDYTVGSPSGSWDESTNLQTWASSKKFMVGDNLIFKYTPMHTVLEVSKTDYESCTTSNPIMTGTSGNTIVPLKAAGKRYFICGIMGHCQILGMKMEVDINPSSPSSPKANPSPPPPSSSTPSNPPPTPSTPSNPPPPSFVPKAPSPPESPFVPNSPPTSSPTTPPKTPPTFSPTAPEPSTTATTPNASPYGGPINHVGSPALAPGASSSPMKGGFKPMMSIAIAMVVIAIHGL